VCGGRGGGGGGGGVGWGGVGFVSRQAECSGQGGDVLGRVSGVGAVVGGKGFEAESMRTARRAESQPSDRSA